MKTLQRELRYINSVVAFEAAARHGSFTGAAGELSITRVALSRRIKNLEDSLNIQLFARQHRGVSLTPEGERFFQTTSTSLREIARAQHRLRMQGESSHITVTTTVAFATYWLIPRLGRFRTQNEGIDVRLVLSDSYLNLDENGIDVAIRWQEREPEEGAIQLIPGAGIPVCSPAYRDRCGKLESPADLSSCSLIMLEGSYLAGAKWPEWFRSHGMAPPSVSDCVYVDSYTGMIQAAISGQGIALGDTPLLDHLVEQGILVWPMDIEPVSTGHFSLLVAATEPGSAHVDQFRIWLIEEIRDSAGR